MSDVITNKEFELFLNLGKSTTQVKGKIHKKI
jgi:hypothetical protein